MMQVPTAAIMVLHRALEDATGDENSEYVPVRWFLVVLL
jgi:hypothetical protein